MVWYHVQLHRRVRLHNIGLQLRDFLCQINHLLRPWSLFCDGLCECDPGYIGEDCSELEIEDCCRVDENGEVFTISGRPCLLGLDDIIGQGFDIVQGTKTVRISQLRYTMGRTFKHNLLLTWVRQPQLC